MVNEEVVFYKEYPNYPHGIWDIAFEEVGLFDVLKEHKLSDRTGEYPDGGQFYSYAKLK